MEPAETTTQAPSAPATQALSAPAPQAPTLAIPPQPHPVLLKLQELWADPRVRAAVTLTALAALLWGVYRLGQENARREEETERLLGR